MIIFGQVQARIWLGPGQDLGLARPSHGQEIGSPSGNQFGRGPSRGGLLGELEDPSPGRISSRRVSQEGLKRTLFEGEGTKIGVLTLPRDPPRRDSRRPFETLSKDLIWSLDQIGYLRR